MNRNFDIRPSEKKGLNSKDMYTVSRGRTVFLRILGDGKHYEVMTATAGEDYDRTRVCREKQRLIQSAILTSKEFGGKPYVTKDLANREYLWIGEFKYILDGITVADSFILVAESFFKHFDNWRTPTDQNMAEVQDIYESLAVDDSGGDVYLSDGVWLSSDGSWRDDGR